MVSLLFKQKLFSWFDSYNIFYDNGDIAFTVKGQLSWGHLLNIYDRNGAKLGYIKEKVITFMPKFDMFINEQRMGTISMQLTLFKPKYQIDFNNWTVQGDILGWNYEIHQSGNLISRATKKIWNMTDTYEIDVMNEQDVLYSLMVVLAIDAANCSQNS